MREQEFINFFPNSTIKQQFEQELNRTLLPLPSGKWLSLDSKTLTINQLNQINRFYQQDNTARWENQSWYRYLVLDKEKINVKASKCQFVHLRVGQDKLPIEIIEIFETFFVAPIAVFQTQENAINFVLDQSVLVIHNQDLQALVHTIESDFGMKIMVLIGQVWQNTDDLPQLFQKEQEIFDSWIVQHAQSICLPFSHLLAWSQHLNDCDITIFIKTLKHMIQKHEDIEQIINALWQEGAIITKAAQRLYLHRNTLQYKMDRFYEHTGLVLKNLDDLALCHFIMLDELY